MRRFYSFLCLLAILFTITTQAQTDRKSAPPDLDVFVNKVLKTFEVPGMSIAIVKDGKVLLTKGYGVKNINEPGNVDAHTLFGIASNSKAFTATALGILVEEGKIKWDDPVIKYLPWFRMSDPYITVHMTIRDLLVHHSGLGLGGGDLLWWPHSTYTREEIERRIAEIPLATSFRHNFAYDNVLYLIAGSVIEKVSGESWEDFIKKNIMDRIGMNESISDITKLPEQKNVAHPHAIVSGKLQTVKPFHDKVTDPAGGINASASDIAKWMIVQLDSGRAANGTQLFTPNTTKNLWELVTPIKVSKTPEQLAPLQHNFYGYGLGFFLTDYRGYKMVTHTGGLPGYVSRITMIPNLKLGVAVFTNQESGAAFSAVTYHILDYYMNAEPFDWLKGYEWLRNQIDSRISSADKKSAEEHDSTAGPSLPLEKYTGTYRDAWYGDVIIELKDNHLVMKFGHTPDLTGDLVHWQYDTFVARWYDKELRADAFVTFSLNPDGSIDQVKMKRFSPSTDFSFDFQDLLLKPVE